MVRAIRHWAISTGMVRETITDKKTRAKHFSPSSLGRFLFHENGADPYMEDSGTLWLIHFTLAGLETSPTTWYWMFNHLSEPDFSPASAVDAIKFEGQKLDWPKQSENTLIRDVNCFIRTYLPPQQSKRAGVEDTLDCPLTELRLITQVENGESYSFARGPHNTLPNAIFAYALARFWDQYAKERRTLQFEEIAYKPGSPGRVFKLTESAIASRLECMESVTEGAISYDVTAGLMQAYRRSDVDPLRILSMHYGKRLPRKHR